MVHRDLHSLVCRCWFRVFLGDPGDSTSWQLDDLRLLTSHFSELATLETTSLEPKSVKDDSSFFCLRCVVEVTSQFEFIDGHLHDAGVALTEGIQECLRMEEITQVDAVLEKRLSLHMLNPADESHTLLVYNSDPVCWVFRAFPFLFPSSRDLV